ncbi:MAG: aminopeptidase P family protein [Lachnospiraceae bacterium]|nr:aminopeptidase P family protein [Lachnospiraceae bacterium]
MNSRLEDLRHFLNSKGIYAYLLTNSDPHNSEYLDDHYKKIEWLTGFTGSNATVVVTMDEALLWTDGRYFVQAEKELKDSGFELMKMGEKGVLSVSDHLKKLLEEGRIFAFDRDSITASFIGKIKKAEPDVIFYDGEDPLDQIWNERPERTAAPIFVLDNEYSGREYYDKLIELQDKMNDWECTQFFENKLDNIMWLLNLRGNDIRCNPVAFSFLFVGGGNTFLFLQNKAVSEDIRLYLVSNRVALCDYEEIEDFLKDYPYEGPTMLSEDSMPYRYWQCIKDGSKIKSVPNVIDLMKSVKNNIEIENMKKSFLYDSLAMTRYLRYLKTSDLTGETEYTIGKKCDEYRAGIPGFLGLSFDTICAYEGNAAMMHYEATENDCSSVYNKGLLLTDCGGQYYGGTTDVTRTVALGEITDEERISFTYVLKGMLRLMNAHFLKGCTGRNLDILARSPLWEHGMDYKCGTGHGVGYCLSVHEGPQNIRWRYNPNMPETVLESGMTVTDEPGVYVKDKYGIRTENTLLVTDDIQTEDGEFLRFEPLTFVPIDLDCVDVNLLDKSEIRMLNEYHKAVCDKLLPLMDSDEAEWLLEATGEVK